MVAASASRKVAPPDYRSGYQQHAEERHQHLEPALLPKVVGGCPPHVARRGFCHAGQAKESAGERGKQHPAEQHLEDQCIEHRIGRPENALPIRKMDIRPSVTLARDAHDNR